jgi:hypothetical protein
MNQEKQRIAIAEACGIVSRDQWGPLYKTALGVVRVCPDYLNDLNAMHEAEKTLTYAQGGEMTLWIQRMTCAGYGPQLFATASQRAEAFIRTVGKWEDDE